MLSGAEASAGIQSCESHTALNPGHLAGGKTLGAEVRGCAFQWVRGRRLERDGRGLAVDVEDTLPRAVVRRESHVVPLATHLEGQVGAEHMRLSEQAGQWIQAAWLSAAARLGTEHHDEPARRLRAGVEKHAPTLRLDPGAEREPRRARVHRGARRQVLAALERPRVAHALGPLAGRHVVAPGEEVVPVGLRQRRHQRDPDGSRAAVALGIADGKGVVVPPHLGVGDLRFVERDRVAGNEVEAAAAGEEQRRVVPRPRPRIECPGGVVVHHHVPAAGEVLARRGRCPHPSAVQRCHVHSRADAFERRVARRRPRLAAVVTDRRQQVLTGGRLGVPEGPVRVVAREHPHRSVRLLPHRRFPLDPTEPRREAPGRQVPRLAEVVGVEDGVALLPCPPILHRLRSVGRSARGRRQRHRRQHPPRAQPVEVLRGGDEELLSLHGWPALPVPGQLPVEPLAARLSQPGEVEAAQVSRRALRGLEVAGAAALVPDRPQLAVHHAQIRLPLVPLPLGIGHRIRAVRRVGEQLFDRRPTPPVATGAEAEPLPGRMLVGVRVAPP